MNSNNNNNFHIVPLTSSPFLLVDFQEEVIKLILVTPKEDNTIALTEHEIQRHKASGVS